MNFNKLLLIPLLFLLYYTKAYAGYVFVKYTIEKDSTLHLKHSVTDYMLDIVSDNWDHVDVNSTKGLAIQKQIIENAPGKETVLIKYTFNRSGTFFITDIFGHEILLDESMDGDTIDLKLTRTKPLAKNSAGRSGDYLNDSISSTKFYVIDYPDKYKYMGFFDSLAYIHGDLHAGGGNYSFKQLEHNIALYLSLVNKVYADRVKFYRDFIHRYNMPAGLRYDAFKEIQFAYYNDLLDPLMEWDADLYNDYPPAMQDSLKSIGNDLNNDHLFADISFYRSVLVYYSYLNIGGKLTSLREQADDEHIINRLNYANQALKGKTKGYFLAWLMNIASNQNLKDTFNALYKSYDGKTSDAGVNKTVESLNEIVNGNDNIPPQQMLNMVFENSGHQQVNFDQVVNKNVILIDCWATWCIPCREQMPALNVLAEEYADRVQFISLSADQSVSKWDAWLLKDVNANKYITQLHAPDAIEHRFFKLLHINAIPRYILVSREGKLLNTTMPFPSETAAFKKELEKYLKN
ncbi:TlpA family protein disulfide reductase [Mucilaginibacter segetis]|uniref:TlpA family protein disulfide reductase n=1 Tax=Mucilaginibacter segetis TaxID=2793071 RepID=A0A934PTI7_9SPHI|nr:TlpA disulfide reductase family protein [Mucilaginibacter segetis]MBK0378896.1 TlpA family protein disulfide reductase [Mucilaginibacter segetis]